MANEVGGGASSRKRHNKRGSYTRGLAFRRGMREFTEQPGPQAFARTMRGTMSGRDIVAPMARSIGRSAGELAKHAAPKVRMVPAVKITRPRVQLAVPQRRKKAKTRAGYFDLT